MKCDLCKQDAAFQTGVAKYDKRTVSQVIGSVCENHVPEALENITRQCYGTGLWACVLDMNGKLLHHSYDADQQGRSAALGWKNS